MEKITICAMGRVFQVEAKDKKDGLILAADMAQAMCDVQEYDKCITTGKVKDEDMIRVIDTDAMEEGE